MTLKHLTHDQINKKRWEKTILESFNGNLYAFAWYLDIVSPGWEALVSDNYDVVIPLPIKKVLGYRILQQPLFTQQLGIFALNVTSLNHTEEYINQALDLFSYSQFQTNKHNLIDFHKLNHAELQEKVNYELDLIPSYSYLWKNYHTNTKRNIQKARKNKLTLKVNHISTQTFVNFIRKNVGFKVSQLKEKDYLKMQQILNFADKFKFGENYAVYDEYERLISSAYFIFSHQKAYYLFAANSPIGKEKRAMFYLMDEFIKRYAEKNVILDFEGSMIPNLARYYESFGASAGKYYLIKSNRLPCILRWIKK